MNTYIMSIKARVENLKKIWDYIDGKLIEAGCPRKQRRQIEIAVEEVYVNICHYAYGPKGGEAEISIEIEEDPHLAKISFSDNGKPFDPLSKNEPDISLGLEERPIGGLGIYMTRKLMDDVQYRYEDGKNHLTMIKYFNPDVGKRG